MDINRKKADKKFILWEVVRYIFSFVFYFLIRLRIFLLYLWAFCIWLFLLLSDLKDWIVQRMFWGRSSLYRSAFQFIVGLLTFIIAIGGLSGRLNLFISSPSELFFPSETLGEADYLNESMSMQAIVSNVSLARGFDVQVYVVQKGDTLSAIASKFEVSADTVRWANGITGDYLRIGQSLEIPPINGVIHLVKKGDTLAKIAEKYQAAVQDIYDINWLESDVLKEGQELLVPNGRMPQPKPVIQPVSAGSYGQPGNVDMSGAGGTGNLIRPCGCGKITNWFSAWHGGVDIAQSGGCQIVAADNGVVTMARWYGAGGLQVMINHGNGFVTLYAHNASIYVKEGDRVTRGQPISYMGCTGRCTGTHLHFGVQRNGVWVNPLAYVPI